MSKGIVRLAVGIVGISTLLTVGSGCATVTGGGRDQNIKITSNPAGATVLVDGQAVGQTPADVKLCRKTEHQVEVAYPGCETAQMTIHRKLNPWVFGNLVVGGPIGLIVDVCTDATHQLTPDEIKVQLRSQMQTTGVTSAAN
jgi:hypothetical protein